MEMIIQIVMVLLVIISLLYVVVIGLLGYGWIKTPEQTNMNDELTRKVSVIIAARNEEYNIALCLRALVNQSYPTSHMEIIVVDDNSEDATSKHIKRFAEQYHFIKHLSLHEKDGELGKKKALEKAIKQCSGELIITTDADCIMDMDWIRLMVSFQAKENAELIVGPVCFHREKTVFEKMQSLEFISLVACGAGALYFNKAILCNGANLMYTRKAYQEVNGFEGINSSPSGDDVLLMYKIGKRYKGKIKFFKNKDAIVYTKARKNLKDFLQQRKRWTSKKVAQLNSSTIFISFLVYLYNLLLLGLPVLYFSSPHCDCTEVSFLKTWLFIFLSKCVIDFLLLLLASSFFQKKKWLLFFIPEQLIYIPYVVIIGLLGIAGGYKWKGRKIKK